LYHDLILARARQLPAHAARRRGEPTRPARRNPTLSRSELREAVIAILG